MRQMYQRLVARVSNQSPSSSTETPSTPTTPGRKNLSHELRVDPELQQRRQLYHCGTNFYTIDEIAKWSSHHNSGTRGDDTQSQKLQIPVRNVQLDAIVLPRKKKDNNNNNNNHIMNHHHNNKGQEKENDKNNKSELIRARHQTLSCESPGSVNNNKNNKAPVPSPLTTRSAVQSLITRPSLSEFNADINEKISFWRGDITELEIDAIVSPSNEKLSGGGSGTDFNIHRAAGPELAFFNSSLGACSVGSARLSPGYRLPSKHVISTVVPLKENELALRSCYLSCLDIASLHKEIQTVAFSCIVAGEYEREFVKATEIAMRTVRRWLEVPYNRAKIDRIIFVVQSDVAEKVYQELLPLYFPTADDRQLNQRATISSPASGHYQ